MYTSVVVIVNVGFYGIHELTFTGKPPTIIHFSLENAPKSFHRPIVNAAGYAGHTLLHALFFQFLVKYSVRVLKASIAVEEGLGIRICLYCLIQSLEYQRVIVVVTNNKGYDSSVVKVKDGTQVHFVHHCSFIPLEFRHIGQPFLIGFICIKLAGEQVFGNILWILRTSGAAMAAVFNGGFYAFLPAYPEDALVVYMNAMVVP